MIDIANLLLPWLTGLSIAIASGYLGIFVISNRLAFLSDALAHATLLGISTSLLLSMPVNIGLVITALLFAVVFSWLLSRANLSSDTIIGILAHSFLALSLLSISFFYNQQIDLEHYLFGEILQVSMQNLIWAGLCLFLTAIFLTRHWQDLILFTLHEDLARVEGINTTRLRLMLTLLLAFLIAVSIQLIGALLISALLLIPSSTARQWANSPQRMALLASLFACVAVSLGLALSYYASTPSGPSIVVMNLLFFIFSLSFNAYKKKN